MASPQAFESGLSLGYQRAQEPRLRKQALSDEEHAQKINDQIALRSANMEKLRNLPKVLPDGKPNPEYDAAHKGIFDAETSLRTLYHPENHPDAIAKFGHLLTDHLKITSPEQRAGAEQRKNVQNLAGDEKATQQFASALPPSDIDAARSAAQAQSAGVQEKVTQDQKLWDQNNIGADEDQRKKAHQEIFESAVLGYKHTPTSDRGSWDVVSGTKDGKPFSYYHDKYTNRNTTMDGADLDAGDLEGFIPAAKGGPKPSSAAEAQWIRATYGKDLDQLSPQQAQEAVSRYRQLNTPAVTNTGQTLVYDQNNQPHVFTHTGTSTKTFPGAKSAPSAVSPDARSGTSTPEQTTSTAPPSPADLRKEAEKRRPTGAGGLPKSPIGPVIPGFTKLSPDVTAANKKYNDAVGLLSFANSVLKHPENPQEQRNFAVQMARVMGNRFQMQEYDLEVKNSGVANTFEQWLNNFSTGALPKQIVDHLVQSARDYKDAAAAEVQAAKGEGGGQGNSGGGVPQGATHIVNWTDPQTHKVHKFYVDKDGNNLGEKTQ